MKPIEKVKANQCYQCGGKLILVESEELVSKLSEDGYPINTDLDSTYDATLICTECGATYDAAKKGMYYYIAPKCKVIKTKKTRSYNPFAK